MKHRPERLAHLIQEELSKMVLRDLEFPGCLVTITNVEVNSKLEQAIINFSVIPSEKINEVLEILNRNRNHLQYLLLRKMNIRIMPRIVFGVDRGVEEAIDIEKLLMEDKIK